MTFSILSYNLRDFGASPAQTHAAQLRWLRRHPATVLAVQELWDDSPGHRRLPDLVADIAEQLGMQGRPVPAPRSHCHLGLFWQPDVTLVDFTALEWIMWHGIGVATLDLPAGRRWRVAVTHLAPSNPPQRLSEAYCVAKIGDSTLPTVIAADYNTIGDDPGYDPEPDPTALTLSQRVRRSGWPDHPHRVDRRPTALLTETGLLDVAVLLGCPWQPTADLDKGAGTRIDGFRLNPAAARIASGPDPTSTPRPGRRTPATGRTATYQVHDSDRLRELSDHLPVRLTLHP